MKTLALVMIVKNEENKIRRCIDSIKDIVNEIIIVDTGSTDSTKSIAVDKGAKVFDYEWKNDFADARNFSIRQSTSDWNLVLDADEYILSGHRLLRDFIEKNNNKIGRINILSEYLTDGQKQLESSYVSRLFPNNRIFFKGRVHEQIESVLPRVNVSVNVAHDGYYQTDKTDRNLPLLFEELKVSPSDAYILYQIAKQYYLKKDYTKANKYFSSSYKNMDTHVYFKPNMVVDYMYSLIKSGNLDFGLRIIEKEKNNLALSTDFLFVCGVFFMELVFSNVNKNIKYFPLIERQYLRCLEIDEDKKQEIVKGTGSYLALYNLGTVYETTGNKDKAIEYYKKSSEYKYKPAQKRLEALMN
ncbi:glycosyltransferase [Metabacillus idriensis]|uniref:tetratricopeptide repeat-containing glycosyltransferase family 2 protein n=1 Tax=Metabacillus idriensis TaxID=324768 RepID=UPI00174D5CEA|nr:glycosyltransferase [Metabacillus idriensis]